jgi:hypothetical protein
MKWWFVMAAVACSRAGAEVPMIDSGVVNFGSSRMATIALRGDGEQRPTAVMEASAPP